MHVVLGLGQTGFSVIRYLQAQGHAVTVMDSREQPPQLATLQQQFPDVPYVLGDFDQKILLAAERIIISPGIALADSQLSAPQAQGIPIVGDVELFAQAAIAPVVGITGTNGKSTVTTLIGEMAKAAGVQVAVGGNIGVPVLDLLDERVELYVLELSSFQLETTHSLALDVALLLNVSPDHDDRYACFADYVAAKQRIFNHAQLAVYNRDDAFTTPQTTTAHQQSFALTPPAGPNDLGVQDEQLICGIRTLASYAQLHEPSPNFINNSLAALSVALFYDWPLPAVVNVLQNFQGLAHRCQFICEYQGVRWYNDSKATNVGAVQAALANIAAQISGKQIVILGGRSKGTDFTELHASLAHYAKAVLLIGEAKAQIAPHVPKTLPMTLVDDFEQAVQVAQQQASQGDAVVLAPACASFDMFADYQARGHTFMTCVKKACHVKTT